ncbi:FAD binding domain protein [Xylogone sp. PMI_703]|nr:FAD binding domain protein [Xylogone sp. PMI_703]
MAVEKNSFVEVLIIGAGPAGLMLATWLGRYGVITRIVDKRQAGNYRGHADGLQSRTFEIFDSFGFGNKIWQTANRMSEMCLWNPDESGKIYRSDRVVDTIPGISRFQQATLYQGRIEHQLLKCMKRQGNISVERGVMPTSLNLDISLVDDSDAYPITVTLKHLSKEDNSSGTSPRRITQKDLIESNTSSLETVRAKYVVGCDGAHSWTRQQLGFTMKGNQTDYIWSVLDIVPITDFPDIRYRCAIHSHSSGSMMVIPREDNIVRLYIQMSHSDFPGGIVDRSNISPEKILKSANAILSPYTISYKKCQWWTTYQIGQRIANALSDHERIFLAGDAVHTHSPKAGQGMNISMQDTYNLGWKLAMVIKGLAKRNILPTYSSERRQVAQQLIDFDKRFSHLFSGRPAKDILDKEGIDLEEFKAVLEKGNMFTSGISVNYGSGILVVKSSKGSESGPNNGVIGSVQRVPVEGKQLLAKNIPLGMRMPSYQVLNQSDARPWQFQEMLISNGCWRLVVFAGRIDHTEQLERYIQLGKRLDAPDSFLRRFTPPGAGIHSVFEIFTIHSAPRTRIELATFPEIFRPFSEEDGWDYKKIFVDDVSYHYGHGQAYQNYGVDQIRGCVIIVRPDQHVSWIGNLEEVDEMDQFFSTFMIAKGKV